MQIITDDDYMGFLPKFLREPVTPMPDCNNCKWLNITEMEKEQVKRRTIMNEHACMLYERRVFHKANMVRHDGFIFPCDECRDDDYKHMEVR